MQTLNCLVRIILLSALVTFASSATAQAQVGVPIGAVTVTFDNSVVNASGNVDAFMSTSSDSSTCLVTLGDSNGFSSGPSPAICVPRTFEGQQGIRIVVIPYFLPFPANLTMTVTVYQLRAHGYGQAVLYTGP